jgi:hypothetical protein
MAEMDAETVKLIAHLARKRAAAYRTCLEGDVQARHGAIGALRQIAAQAGSRRTLSFPLASSFVLCSDSASTRGLSTCVRGLRPTTPTCPCST